MERDRSIDQIRGFAAIIVVIGHVFQLFNNYSLSTVFNIIFSIQMPLFMAVSGYTTIYSKTIINLKCALERIKKRSISILLPWFVWTILVFIFKGQMPLGGYIKFVVYHMESAYWFLFSLWCIDFLFVWATLISHKIIKHNKIILVVESGISCIFILALLLLGTKVGMTFLGIKYTTYYFLYYLLGRYIALIRSYCRLEKYNRAIDGLMLAFLGLYFLLISKYNVIEMEDNLGNIIIRCIISVSACVFLFYFFKKIQGGGTINRFLEAVGNYSLELYVVQIFTLAIIPIKGIELCTIQGYLYCVVDIIFVFLFSFILIKIININPLARFILFGKGNLRKRSN